MAANRSALIFSKNLLPHLRKGGLESCFLRCVTKMFNLPAVSMIQLRGESGVMLSSTRKITFPGAVNSWTLIVAYPWDQFLPTWKGYLITILMIAIATGLLVWWWHLQRERKRLIRAKEHAQKIQDRLIRLFFNLLPQAILMVDHESEQIIRWNERSKQFFPEISSDTKLSSLLSPENHAKLKTAVTEFMGRHGDSSDTTTTSVGFMTGNTILDAEKENAGGTIFESSFSIVNMQEKKIMLLMLRDITQKYHEELKLKQLNEKIQALYTRQHHEMAEKIQEKRIEGIGHLASGLAHEINNPLGFIRSNLKSLGEYIEGMFRLNEALEEYLGMTAGNANKEAAAVRQKIEQIRHEIDWEYLKDDIHSLLAEAQDGVERIAKHVRVLREFSGVDELPSTEVDVKQVIQRVIETAEQSTSYKDYRIQTRFSENIPPVYCEPGKLRQCLWELVQNAIQACPDEGGNILIRVEAEENAVIVQIADNGIGMNREEIARAFDPFYTGKDVGEGSGVGLTMVHSFITRIGGQIRIESQKGEGTVIILTIPTKRETEQNAGN
ncbi:MAG: sensor histidine kinase [Lentisphaerae bacterium]|nr:MAG: sensor histidine kinase [Lentisphaerota bacterium]